MRPTRRRKRMATRRAPCRGWRGSAGRGRPSGWSLGMGAVSLGRSGGAARLAPPVLPGAAAGPRRHACDCGCAPGARGCANRRLGFHACRRGLPGPLLDVLAGLCAEWWRPLISAAWREQGGERGAPHSGHLRGCPPGHGSQWDMSRVVSRLPGQHRMWAPGGSWTLVRRSGPEPAVRELRQQRPAAGLSARVADTDGSVFDCADLLLARAGCAAMPRAGVGVLACGAALAAHGSAHPPVRGRRRYLHMGQFVLRWGAHRRPPGGPCGRPLMRAPAHEPATDPLSRCARACTTGLSTTPDWARARGWRWLRGSAPCAPAPPASGGGSGGARSSKCTAVERRGKNSVLISTLAQAQPCVDTWHT